MSLLEIARLVGGYGETDILNGIDLAVEEGEILTVAGTNGAGKSTLAKAVMGLLRDRAGRRAAVVDPGDGFGDQMQSRVGIAEDVELGHVTCGMRGLGAHFARRAALRGKTAKLEIARAVKPAHSIFSMQN